MPTFKEDWKKAKTAFETATHKKKPSTSFLGVFNKGTGISSTLESADKAKTAGELNSAMTAFQKAYTDYLKTLDKAITDPKTTPIADKATYAEAVKKLKLALEAIHDSAHGTMQTIVDAGALKKDKVDPAALRKAADAEKGVQAWIARRLALAKSLETLLSGYKGKGIEDAAANAIKQAQAAKTAKAAGNSMGADVAAGASGKFAEQANTALAAIADHWKATSTKGEMIDLRQDGGFYPSLPPAKEAGYKQQNAAAWNATEKVQRDINAYIAPLRTEVLKAMTAAEGAEVYLTGRMTPEVHLKRLTEMKARLQAIENGVLTKYGGKAPNVREMQKNYAAKAATDPTFKATVTKQWGQLKTEHEHALTQTAQQLTEMTEIQNRLKGIPQDDKAVKESGADVGVVLGRVRKMAQDYTAQGTLLIKELQTYMA